MTGHESKPDKGESEERADQLETGRAVHEADSRRFLTQPEPEQWVRKRKQTSVTSDTKMKGEQRGPNNCWEWNKTGEAEKPHTGREGFHQSQEKKALLFLDL